MNNKLNMIYEMNEEQLIECYNEVIAKHEEARIAYKAAKTEEERKAVEITYPDYQNGHTAHTPARIAFVELKRNFVAYSDLADMKLMENCERVLLNSPDAPEYCYHVANLRKAPWVYAEFQIAKSGWFSYRYAEAVLKGPFPAGEEAIRSNEKYSEHYDRFLNGLELNTTTGGAE